ncbi:hypothetical protein ADMFC3_27930 [Geovibrio sp. ADMFC3]
MATYQKLRQKPMNETCCDCENYYPMLFRGQRLSSCGECWSGVNKGFLVRYDEKPCENFKPEKSKEGNTHE